MATLTIRNLPNAVRDALRQQAAAHQRSMEAEAREVLSAAVGLQRDPAAEAQAIAALQALGDEVAARLPDGWSLVDELVAERRLEAAAETGAVTVDERQQWMERLSRFEVWPAEVEAFLATRA
jgi:plasmid stability protein